LKIGEALKDRYCLGACPRTNVKEMPGDSGMFPRSIYSEMNFKKFQERFVSQPIQRGVEVHTFVVQRCVGFREEEALSPFRITKPHISRNQYSLPG
jgi:hypothetical protein